MEKVLCTFIALEVLFFALREKIICLQGMNTG